MRGQDLGAVALLLAALAPEEADPDREDRSVAATLYLAHVLETLRHAAERYLKSHS